MYITYLSLIKARSTISLVFLQPEGAITKKTVTQMCNPLSS